MLFVVCFVLVDDCWQLVVGCCFFWFLVVGCCSLFVVRCLLFVDGCSLFIGRGLRTVVCCFGVRCLIIDVCELLILFVVCCLLFVVCCLLIDVC